MPTGAQLVAKASEVTSARTIAYRTGVAQPPPSDPAPTHFDCSGLVAWVVGQFGLAFVPYTVTQWNACKGAGRAVSVAEALATPGALLFRHVVPGTTQPFDPPPGFQLAREHRGHVAISAGDGFGIEAMGSQPGQGVGRKRLAGRDWTHGGLIPGVDYGARPAAETNSGGGGGGGGFQPPPRPANRAGRLPACPGEAGPGSPAPLVQAWQVAMIGLGIIRDTPGNRDGVYGPGLTARVTELQQSFGWTNPDGRAGAHTWDHMHTRAEPVCPRCGR